MIFHVTSMARPKRMAKLLRRLMEGAGHPTPLSRCQEMIARMYGHASWRALVEAPKDRASPPDEDCPKVEVDRRRSLQTETIGDEGVDWFLAPDLARALAATARGGAPSPALPRLVVRGRVRRRVEGPNPTREHDLTEDLVDFLRRYRNGAALVEDAVAAYEAGDGTRPFTLAPHFQSYLEMEDFVPQWRRFRDEVGDLSDPRVVEAFRDRLNEARDSEWRIGRAARLLADVEKARLAEDETGFEMFCAAPGFEPGDGFVSSACDAYSTWGWNAFGEIDPVPDVEYDHPDRDAWRRRYATWRDERTPPFVFGTAAVEWRGIAPERLREEAEENRAIRAEDVEDGHAADGDGPDPVDVDDMIANDLEGEHHEDAYGQVVAIEDLEAVVEEWQPHAGSGDEVDRGFDARVAAWNARQSITSFASDEGTIVPVIEGTTKESAVDWCRRHLGATLEHSWDILRWTPLSFDDEDTEA